MLSLLVTLIIASQITTPISGIVLGAQTKSTEMPTRLVTDSFEPVIDSSSALVLDSSSERILFQKNGYDKRPIASITKLMTALVFLERDVDPKASAVIRYDDKKSGGRFEVAPGEVMYLEDILNAGVIGSVNSMMYALAGSTDLTHEEFVRRMNEKAREIGMKNTTFVEPSGLSSLNQSTAMDVALLVQEAMKEDLIKKALETEVYYFTTMGGVRHMIKNTNFLLSGYSGEVIGKTGYTNEAGYCFASYIDCQGNCADSGIITVLLGSPSKDMRFQETKFLIEWVFKNWSWQ